MKIYSYIVTTDTGFAPNPFHGHLTLACCKPQIRRTAQIGDWVVGLSKRSEHVVYAMCVAEKLSFHQYWSDPRFESKRPDKASRMPTVRRGDSIYEPFGLGTFRQLRSSRLQKNGTEDVTAMKHDLGGRHVLVGVEFVYFGGAGPRLPTALEFLQVGRGHRCRFTQEQVETFLAWVSNQPRGIQRRPAKWPVDDDSWRESL